MVIFRIDYYFIWLDVNNLFSLNTFAPLHCPGVEIGRQATLRWWCSKERAGSNPVLGTNNLKISYLKCIFKIISIISINTLTFALPKRSF